MNNTVRVKFTVTVEKDRYSYTGGASEVEMDVPETLIQNGKVDFSMFLAGMVPDAYQKYLEKTEEEQC